MPQEDLSQETIDAIKQKYPGDLISMMSPAGVLVFRKPSRHERERYFVKISANTGDTFKAGHELAQCCIVHPEPGGPGALIAAMDAVPDYLLLHVMPALNRMCGEEYEAHAKKL